MSNVGESQGPVPYVFRAITQHLVLESRGSYIIEYIIGV